MHLLHNDNGKLTLAKNVNESTAAYAILSHTWGDDAQEVLFEDMAQDNLDRAKSKAGFEKVQFCVERAKEAGLSYSWIDTCCINKADAVELNRSINSMFRWYRHAKRCYVYLSDVSVSSREVGLPGRAWEHAFRQSRWFKRGWTLQELLAPVCVLFFSKEGQYLGDKHSLRQLVYEITTIPMDALSSYEKSRFSDAQRFNWINSRDTKEEEDIAYCLLGLFDVSMPLVYGEGKDKAIRRLQKEIEEKLPPLNPRDKDCVRDLRLLDPRDDKTRIQETKGGLFQDAYRWILENNSFRQWRSGPQGRVLWIRGDPGKGKTMLLCGIIDELEPSNTCLSYFFCQATNEQLNHATAVLRGLIYMLVLQRPALISHIRRKYDDAGKRLFEEINAWQALCKILTDMLADEQAANAVLLVDALDECTSGLPELLQFICKPSGAKWVVSSRNWPNIERKLTGVEQNAQLHLELNQRAISDAVAVYIRHRVEQLAQEKKYDNETKDGIMQHLTSNADGTFLWVALVCQVLADTTRRKALEKAKSFPKGLSSIYNRMIAGINNSEDAEDRDICKDILAIASTVYRPIALTELYVLCASLEDYSMDDIHEIVQLCGSFLTVRDGILYFVHQSAKDYLVEEAAHHIFPSGIPNRHATIASRSLTALSSSLKRDVYNLGDPGCSVNEVIRPGCDPLAPIRYSCLFWVDHLEKADGTGAGLQDGGQVHKFLQEKFLYWLEALSLFKSISNGVVAIRKLEYLALETGQALSGLIYDARRFILSHKHIIDIAPLQTYASALLFSPERSKLRNLFRAEMPVGVQIVPTLSVDWSACLQTLEGHSDSVKSVVFSPDGTQLATGSYDTTVRLWDTASGQCTQKLEGHSRWVQSVVFSPDGTQLASGSQDSTVKLWDTASGQCMQTLRGHRYSVTSVVFSPDGTQLASGSHDSTIRLWDTALGQYTQTLAGHNDVITSVVFSPDGTQLASGSKDSTIKLWDMALGQCTQTLAGHRYSVTLVVFSPDGTQLATGSDDTTIRLWDITSGQCTQKLKGHSRWIQSVIFSPDGTQLASGSHDNTIKLWDTSSGQCTQTLKGHNDLITSIIFSPNGTQLATGSQDSTVKLWDTASGQCMQTLAGHRYSITLVVFSPDGTQLATGSDDTTVRLWDITSGQCTQKLKGHSRWVQSVIISPDGTQLASDSHDYTIKLWDTASKQCTQTFEGHRFSVTSIIFSPDGTLASGSKDNTIKLWDTALGQCTQTLEGHNDSITSIIFSPNGTQLATGSYDTTIRLWDIASGQCIQTLAGHRYSITSVKFSPDGTQLASSSNDKTIKLWDTASGQCIQTLAGHRYSVTSVSFSPDGTQLASGSNDKTVKLWNTASGECTQTLEGHSNSVTSVVFSPDGTLASGSDDRIVKLWDTASGVCRRTLVNYTGQVTSNIFSPCDRQYDVSVDNNWVIKNGHKVLWLPSEWRPRKFSISGQSIGIGCPSGRVFFIIFKG